MTTNVDIVIGMDWGSEGKGEFVAWKAATEAKLNPYSAVVRIGGPQAGHTMTLGDETHKMRQIPCAWHVEPTPALVIAAGSIVDKNVLNAEMKMVWAELVKRGGGYRRYGGDAPPDAGLPYIAIDRNAVMLHERHPDIEAAAGLGKKLGSTLEGVGAARADHVMREHILVDDRRQFGNYPMLHIGADTGAMLRDMERDEKRILIETAQGFELSLTASGNYPFVTSRDVTPGIALNDVGLSSRVNHHVIGVARCYPIRVAGNSGKLPNEIEWDELMAHAAHIEKPETTTVTKRTRRIADFDAERLARACYVVRPDALALTFVDYRFPELHMETNVRKIREVAGGFIAMVEVETGVDVQYVSTGPGVVTRFSHSW